MWHSDEAASDARVADVHVTPRTGTLVEPLTGRRCEPREVQLRVAARTRELQRHGLRVGDRVFIHFGNTIDFFVDVLAVWWLGGSVVPLDPRLTPFELGVLADAARPRLSLWLEPDGEAADTLSALDVRVLAEADLLDPPPASPPPPQLSLDDEALILFTSGTTGNPKGVVHTHRTLRARWTSLDQSLGRAAFARTLCLLPTHFGHGLICNCLFPWLSGADLFLLPPFRPDVVSRLGSLVDEERITFFSSVPSVWRLALRMSHPPERGSLERIFCGSAPLSRAQWQQIGAWSGGAEVMNAYGITETGSWVAGTTVPGVEPDDGLIGVPWGAAVAVVQDGEEGPPGLAEECAPDEAGDVWLNTPALMRGYLDRPDLTADVVRSGWFRTGDIGLLDERGLLYLRGRKREEINKGGMKVYPGDVDTVAEQLAGVTDACAFAIDDSLYGQDVGLAVVVEDGNAAIAESLRAGLELRLARHQLPTRVYVLDAIPRTSRGKLNRADVAALCAEREPVRLQRG